MALQSSTDHGHHMASINMAPINITFINIATINMASINMASTNKQQHELHQGTVLMAGARGGSVKRQRVTNAALSSLFNYCSGSQSREWCIPHCTGLPISMNAIKITPHGHAQRLTSPRYFLLNLIKLTIVINHHITKDRLP